MNANAYRIFLILRDAGHNASDVIARLGFSEPADDIEDAVGALMEYLDGTEIDR